jgi:hypothetical protein
MVFMFCLSYLNEIIFQQILLLNFSIVNDSLQINKLSRFYFSRL